ncbi:MAG: ankyrin repeat domain-containing protein [Planctomycetota bacterium]
MCRLKMVFGALSVVVWAAGSAAAGDAFDAARKGDVAALTGMLKEQPKLLQALDSEKNTLLHVAARAGQVGVCKLLLDKGIPVDTGDREGSTALEVAASSGRIEVARLLLARKSNVKHHDANGWSALHFAIRNNQLPMAKELLAAGADPDAVTVHQETPLLLALWSGSNSKALVKLLLEARANPNPRQGPAPLFVAARENRPDIIEMLLEKGADIAWKSPFGMTVLHATTWEDSVEAARMLLKRGADANAPDGTGQTPLMMAAVQNSLRVFDLLLEHGADPNATEAEGGKTVLHIAAVRGDRDLAHRLIERGAHVNAKDSSGKTPLNYAGRYGHQDVADYLIDHGGEAEDLEENYGGAPLLAEELESGAAVLWYLGHCGWAVKTRQHLLVFDYWNPGEDPSDPSLTNGRVSPAEIAQQQVTVFVTHEHQDHFDPRILAWRSELPRITYVFGLQPQHLPAGSPRELPNTVWVAPRQSYTVNGMSVRTIKANDAGVGFLVTVDGITLYHAGDHAGWREGERDGFTSEIDYLAEQTQRVDIAFVNVTGCHAHGEEPLRESLTYTLEKLAPKVLVPTHALNRESVYRQTANELGAAGYPGKVLCPGYRGDLFVFRGDGIAKNMRP